MRLFNKQNRKRKAPAITLPLPVAAALLIIGTLALGYLWISDRCESLGGHIKTLEGRKVLLHNRVLAEEARLAMLKSPANIVRLLDSFSIVMDWPDEGRVLRLPARLDEAGRALAARRQFAQRRDTAMND